MAHIWYITFHTLTLHKYIYMIIQVHNKVGQEVRNAIKRVGGVLPEDQSTIEKSIDEIAKEQIKKLKKKKKLFLDE